MFTYKYFAEKILLKKKVWSISSLVGQIYMLAVAGLSLLIPELKIFLKTILKINSLQRAVLFLIEYFVIKYKRLNFSNE